MKKDLGVYLHIPFCEKKCEYCDFLSGVASDRVKKKYVEALRAEIRSYGDIVDQYRLKTVFIGGGTPSCLDALDISSILAELKAVFNFKEFGCGQETIEVTIEANPGTLSREKLKIYREAGVNRLSIGLQSTNNKELKELGRIHTYEEFVVNYKVAREVGFKNISVDLISGLPRQTVEEWEKTLNKVVDLKPEHISAYSLIIEEGTPFFDKYGNENASELISEETDRLIYERTKQILEQNGFMRYEISNYAKNGYESQHNSSYWERKEYIGMGLGASSLWNRMRFRNEDHLKEYMRLSSCYLNIRREIQQLTQKQEMEEFMFLGLRMMKGIRKLDFLEHFDCDINQIYGTVFEKLKKEKLIIIEEDCVRLTERGIDISNYVFMQFLLD